MAEKIIIRQANKEDFKAISTLIALQNEVPETQCIHSDTGGDAANLFNEITRLSESNEIFFMMAFNGEKLIGVLGCELDVELGFGWLRGPFITGSKTDWNETANLLYAALINQLPASIHRLDTFLNQKNQKGNAFYLDCGFQRLRLVHVYECLPPGGSVKPGEGCELLPPEYQQVFVELHDLIFPGTYATGRRIIEKMDGQHQVFVCRQEGEIVGYCCANIDEDTGEGSFDFLGVHEAFRGKGIGRKLMQSALYWFFEVKKLPKVILVVHDDLANARSLYESAGFRLKYTGVHNRKSWQ